MCIATISADTVVLTVAAITGPVVAVVLTLIGQARMNRSTEAFQQKLMHDLEEERRKFDRFREEERRKFDAALEEERRKFALIREEERMKFDQTWDRADLNRKEWITTELKNIVRALNPKVKYTDRGAVFPE
jgi:hypothetical protein